MQLVSSPFRTPEFLALFREWNRILEKDGHPEIEDFSRADAPLKTWVMFDWTAQNSAEKYQHVHQYYEIADRVLQTHTFKSEKHRMIWELHCEGLSVRQITRGLRFWLWFVSKSNVQNIIQEIEKKTGMRRG